MGFHPARSCCSPYVAPLLAGTVALILSLVTLPLAPPAAHAEEVNARFTRVSITGGSGCRGIGVLVPLSTLVNIDAYVPRDLVPLPPRAVLLDVAECEKGTVNGRPIGHFSYADVGIVINSGMTIPTTTFTMGTSAIYSLATLTTSPRIARLRKKQGYPAQVARITYGSRPGWVTSASGSVTAQTVGFSFHARMSRPMIPATLVPFGPLSEQWCGPRQRRLLTVHEVSAYGQPATGMAWVRFPPNSLLANLFGTTHVVGNASSGAAKSFTSTTYRVTYGPTPRSARN